MGCIFGLVGGEIWVIFLLDFLQILKPQLQNLKIISTQDMLPGRCYLFQYSSYTGLEILFCIV